MDFSGAGTAIMLALAAVLWFLYLLPTWMRRREFLATERNATRLQRAIRVMAESAEVPAEMRIEANAREAAQRERLLRQQQRRADAEARAEVNAEAARARAAEARAAEATRVAELAARAARVAGPTRTAPAPATRPSDASRAGLRRARRLAGLLLLAAIMVAGVQLWLMATTGAVVGSWIVLAACASAGGLSVALQQRVVARSRESAVRAPIAARRVPSPLLDAEPIAEPVREWTPVPIPKPLYLERQETPRVSPSVAAEELRAAAAEAERALVAAHAEPEVVPFRPRAVPAAAAPAAAAAPSRFASMGLVDASTGELPDLDEVLRRRRLG